MDYKELASRCLKRSKMEYEDATMIMLECSAKAITDLLARAEAAEARCETLEKMVKEYQDEIVPGYRERAEKADRERDEAVEVICARCSVLPCRENECYWYRGQKEE